MELPNTFVWLLQVFLPVMNEPTAVSFRQLVVGWLFAPRRTVLEMVRVSACGRHHAAFHRVFATAKWSIDQVGMRLLDLILTFQSESTVFVAGDDTFCPRRGPKVFGAGVHRDPVLSTRGHKVKRWGHCWVVLCVILHSHRTPGRFFALPVMARLYLTTAAAKKWRRKYRSKTDLIVEMVERVHRHLGERKLHFLGDSAYTAPAVMGRLSRQIEVTGRVQLNARLYAAPPPRDPHRRGQPAKRGQRLPNPEQMLQAGRLRRLKMRVRQDSRYDVRIAETVARFFRTPDRPVRIVAVEHLIGRRGREVFYSTESEAKAEQVLEWFARRWPIEVTFHETKQHLGLQQPQSRKREAVERTTPTGLILYGLVVLWHECVREHPAERIRSWRGKQAASFADMLAALRLDCLHQAEKQIFNPNQQAPLQKIFQILQRILALAA